MLPVLGPSTTTDTVGQVLDFFTNPINLIESDRDRLIVRGVDLLDTARSCSAREGHQRDRYLFVRDAFLQRASSRSSTVWWRTTVPRRIRRRVRRRSGDAGASTPKTMRSEYKRRLVKLVRQE